MFRRLQSAAPAERHDAGIRRPRGVPEESAARRVDAVAGDGIRGLRARSRFGRGRHQLGQLVPGTRPRYVRSRGLGRATCKGGPGIFRAKQERVELKRIL